MEAWGEVLGGWGVGVPQPLSLLVLWVPGTAGLPACPLREWGLGGHEGFTFSTKQ